MSQKHLPCSQEKLEEIAQKFGTPFHLYSEKILHERAQNLKNAFPSRLRFKQFFAIKTTPNPEIIHHFLQEGFGVDAANSSELAICEKMGISGENILFTSNGTTKKEFQMAEKLGAIINIDDISLIDRLADSVEQFPELICFRINPGTKKKGNSIIGNPIDAKFGITLKQIIPAYKRAKELGAKRFGIHSMPGSCMLEQEYIPETAEILSDIALDLKKELGIEIEFINAGGGIGIPYRTEEEEIDIAALGKSVADIYSEKFGNNPPKFFLEQGRWLTGPAGWLISRVISQKDIYKKYVILDSCMADFMRPGMYNAYHHITIPGREKDYETVDIVGSLCENNDKFAIDRSLPKVSIDDLVVIHDTGAHGRAMGFNYNGKLRTQEILLKEDGTAELIRRKETLDDYFATLNF